MILRSVEYDKDQFYQTSSTLYNAKNAIKSVFAKWKWSKGRNQQDLIAGKLQTVFKYWIRKNILQHAFF